MGCPGKEVSPERLFFFQFFFSLYGSIVVAFPLLAIILIVKKIAPMPPCPDLVASVEIKVK